MECKNASINVPIQRINAIDGDSVNSNKIIAPLSDWKKYACPRELAKGEIGCFLSHKYIWQQLLDSNSNWGAVFEDDVRISRNINFFIENDDWIPKGVDYIQLFVAESCQKIKYRDKICINKDYCLYQQVKPFPSGTLAYIFSRNFAEKALEMSKVIYAPVDEFISNPAYGLSDVIKVWRLNPAVVTVKDEILTTIGIRDFKDYSHAPLFVRYNPMKFMSKLKWSIIRKLSKDVNITFE